MEWYFFLLPPYIWKPYQFKMGSSGEVGVIGSGMNWHERLAVKEVGADIIAQGVWVVEWLSSTAKRCLLCLVFMYESLISAV